jgi:GT2 family glycosyltransferase
MIVILDPIPELMEFYKSRLSKNVKIIMSEKRGLSNARNVGVRQAKGSIVAFIDDDAVADGRWLESIIKDYEDTDVVGVGGYIQPFWESGRPFWFSEELDWVVGCSYKGLPQHKASVRNPIGCNMSFRKSVFEQVGYFRSDVGRFGKVLLGSEEPEFSLRVLKKIPRSKIVYNPSAVVYHKVGKSRTRFQYLLRRSFYEGVSKALIVDGEGSASSLSTENRYLEYLLKTAVPSKLKRFYSFDSLCQLLALFFSTSAVFLGYFFGRLGRQGK